MSTPKIKVYRLDKGYNQDADNDIQTKVNSEVLPFIEKKSKPTDAYYLTAVSEQKIQYNGEKIDIIPKIIDAPVTGNSSGQIDCTGWVKNGYYRPKVGYIKIVDEQEVFYELASFEKNEDEILKEIEKVNSGQDSVKPYFTKNDFIFAHPFVFTDLEDGCYEIKYSEDGTKIYFELNEEKITDVFGTSPVEPSQYKIQYHTALDTSTSTYLQNYPIYDHENYYYNPQIFTPQKIELTIELDNTELLYRTSQEIVCDDTWVFYGNGSPLVIYNNSIMEKNNYELIYSYIDGERKVVVKISEDFLRENQSGSYILFYNYDGTLLTSGYTIDSNTGKIEFDSMPVDFFVYYYQKTQRSTTFVSENVNWSFGHLRENPDIFFGEKDYPGDEAEDADTGTPLYSGMKPSFVNSGYQIDYMRGKIDFTDGYKSVYKSEAEQLQYRDTSLPETFVRANYSYYPEVFSVFRQKMELVSDIDGYTYKPVSDNRYPSSINKRWIMKSDNYQPMFFENWTDKVNVCSQYLSTAPSYDSLEKKPIIEILSTNSQEQINSKLSFILPVIESQFIVFSGFESELNYNLSFSSNETLIEEFNIKSTIVDGNETFFINDTELKQEEVLEFGTNVKIKFAYLASNVNSETGIKIISFELVSAEIK